MSRSRPPRQQRPGSFGYKPKFPLDPCLEVARLRKPWQLSIDRILAATATNSRRDVILILGAPTVKDLEPLLYSEQFSSSLLIIATHSTSILEISSTAFPAIRLLRLSHPVAVEDAGAVRLVNVLEWAERVGRVWRKKGGHGIQEFHESNMDEITMPQPPPSISRLASAARSGLSSPSSSTEHLPAPRSRATSFKSFTSLSSPRTRKSNAVPPVDLFQRPFDALINFLPQNVNDKALLKQAILVTTISRPFLAAALTMTNSKPQYNAHSSKKSDHRKSSFLERGTIYSNPSTPLYLSRDSLRSSPDSSLFQPELGTNTKAHIIHLVSSTYSSSPGTETKLTQCIESFLISFSHPANVPSEDTLERASSFVMPASVFSAFLGFASSPPPGASFEWFVADLILSGVLDTVTLPHSNPQPMLTHEFLPARAWISGPGDIVIAPPGVPECRPTTNASMPLVNIARLPPTLSRTAAGPNVGALHGTQGQGKLHAASAVVPPPPTTQSTAMRVDVAVPRPIARVGNPNSPDSHGTVYQSHHVIEKKKSRWSLRFWKAGSGQPEGVGVM